MVVSPKFIGTSGTVDLCTKYCSRGALTMLLPALIYSTQNALNYVAISYLDVWLFQTLNQLKMVTTALFSLLLLDRSFSRRQWLGIACCTLGTGIVQFAEPRAAEVRA